MDLREYFITGIITLGSLVLPACEEKPKEIKEVLESKNTQTLEEKVDKNFIKIQEFSNTTRTASVINEGELLIEEKSGNTFSFRRNENTIIVANNLGISEFEVTASSKPYLIGNYVVIRTEYGLLAKNTAGEKRLKRDENIDFLLFESEIGVLKKREVKKKGKVFDTTEKVTDLHSTDNNCETSSRILSGIESIDDLKRDTLFEDTYIVKSNGSTIIKINGSNYVVRGEVEGFLIPFNYDTIEFVYAIDGKIMKIPLKKDKTRMSSVDTYKMLNSITISEGRNIQKTKDNRFSYVTGNVIKKGEEVVYESKKSIQQHTWVSESTIAILYQDFSLEIVNLKTKISRQLGQALEIIR